MAIPAACPGHGHPLPCLSRTAAQVRAWTRVWAWARALRRPHQAELTFPFSRGAGGSSCCSQMLFMQNYYLNYICVLLESLLPPD